MAQNREQRGRSEQERYWGRMIAAWGKSGLTQVEFCRRKGVSVGSLRWWKSTLAAKDRTARFEERPGGSALVRREEPSGTGERAAFLPVDVVHMKPEVESPASDTNGHLVLGIGKRFRIRLTRGFDREVLRSILAVLEEEEC